MKYCPKPFTSIVLFPSKTCCCCPLHSNKKSFLDNKFDSDDYLFTFWNNPEMMDIRNSIINGDYEKYCSQCNLKNIYSKEFSQLPPIVQAAINDKKTIIESPSIIELNFDQSCNLKCKSCRSDIISIVGGENRKKYDNVFNFLLLTSKSQMTININGGGDCFGFECFNFLKRIEDNIDKFPNLNFEIITNGQLFNEKNVERIKNIVSRIRGIMVSVDAATKETYEKIRINGKWETIQTNLQLMKQICKQNKAWFIIIMVVQKGNYKEIGLFKEMGENLNARPMYKYLMDWHKIGSGHEWYKENAIHLPTHPEYDNFLSEAKDITFI